VLNGSRGSRQRSPQTFDDLLLICDQLHNLVEQIFGVATFART
jgi:hypothetical protein